jgi:dienelactone hydrolase
MKKPNLTRRKLILTTVVAGLGICFTKVATGLNLCDLKKLAPLLTDENGNPITSQEEWSRQREMIKQRWLEYLGALKPNPQKPKLIILKEERTEGIIRQLVEYEGEPGIMVRGYLLKPEKIIGPVPGIVAFHSTSDNQMLYLSGVEKGKVVPFGLRLAQQGNIVFCPQCFLWHEKGERKFEEMVRLFQERHPKSKGMAKMLFDAQRAVDVLVSLEEVDSVRIGATGHSLGAKEAFYLGAFDDRVKVIVSNEGGIGIELSNWDAVWYLGKDIANFGHQHHEVLSLAAPKPFLLIGGDSADGEMSRPYIDAVKPIYVLYKKSENLQLFNHGTGHSVHPSAEQKTYEWIEKHL